MIKALRVAALCAVLALAACNTTGGPVVVPPEEIPIPLARTPTMDGGEPTTTVYTVYFVRRGRLAPLRREAPVRLPPAEAAIRALLAGPTADERDRSVTTEIPPNARLLEVRVVDRVAEVDMSEEFQSAASSDSILLRVAQVVWTLVRLPDVTAARFLIDGEPVAVPTDRGLAVTRPVTTPDYVSVAPRRPGEAQSPAPRPARPSPF